jgi:hypothetical protein
VKWYNELIYDLLESSFSIIPVIKSRRMKWGGGIWQVWERGEVDTGILVGKSKRKKPLQIPW